MHAVLEGAEARRKYADLPPKKRVWGFREPKRFRIRKTASQVVETRLEIRLTATIFVSGLSVYNNADQLLEENGITYAYDLNGNLKTKADASGTTTYTWDYEDRLVKVAGPSGTVTYEYDVDGNRVSTTTSAGTTRYLVDTNRALPQVLAEYTPDGTVLASYVYADDLISMTRGNQMRWYHFDGLGSTRLLTDETGAVTDTYSYDAFGNLIARTGTTQNDFLFTGQQRDANAGFYYLRARYYAPGQGRFASVDTFEVDPSAPSTLHKYLYSSADPVNRIDPSGHFSLVELGQSQGVMNVLNTVVRGTTTFLNLYNRASSVLDLISTAKRLFSIAAALQGASPAAAMSVLESELTGAFGPGNYSFLANGFREAFKHISSTWADASSRFVGDIPIISGKVSWHVANRMATYTAWEKAGKLRYIVYTPSATAGGFDEKRVAVNNKLQISVSPGGGRLVGFGIGQVGHVDKNQDQLFRIDYYDYHHSPHGLRYHYHCQPNLDAHWYF